ncbi:hypothetical protein AOLI_G00183030 [Acnodon oligacanthus]
MILEEALRVCAASDSGLILSNLTLQSSSPGEDLEHVTEEREGHNSTSVFDYTTRFMSALMNGESPPKDNRLCFMSYKVIAAQCSGSGV